ncbi:protoporphyrinogen/coproporphyrinogen oxidase [Jeotgalibaca sp. A127]|uniref:protoporphyrinogen/coproporphyrinogen oxidase n=1 Tax=Jeotgalibaca sp. A127 TaxID=3457324 RepID=UPI003FCFBA0B
MLRGKKRIAILGSGLSGLVAAYEVNKRIEAEQLPFEFILLDKRDRIGGIIKTVNTSDGPVDVGASSFDVRRDDIRPFLRELGLEDEIQFSTGGKLDRFSAGEFVSSNKPSYHGIPIQLTDILHEKELSLSDKLSVLINHSFNSMKLERNPEATTAEFLEYRFCKAVSTMIAYPHYPENVFGSMELCPPTFFDHNLIKLFEHTDSRYTLKEVELDHVMDGEATEFNLKGGMSTLVQALTDRMPDNILTGKTVSNLSKMDDDVFLMTLNHNESLRAKAIISTMSLSDAFTLINQGEESLLDIPRPQTASMATILLRFEKGAINRYPDGYGFVVPKRSSFHVTKATLLNRKWPSLKDAEYDLVLVEIGRRQEDTIIQLPDEALLTIISTELKEILALKGTYVSAKIYRWLKSVPHLTPSERQLLYKNEEKQKGNMNTRGFFLGGNGFHGYGMPNAIKEGQRLAHEAITYMKSHIKEL